MHDLGFLLFIIALALLFDFINGFHDTANAVATVVSTRVLTPVLAITMSAGLNLLGALSGTAVAKTIGSGIIGTAVSQEVVAAALIGAIVWNLLTWYFGIPSSSSHALIGGYAGAAVARAGMGAITWGTKWIQTLSFIVVSPFVGMLAGYILMVLVFWLFHKTSATKVDKFFRPAQLLSSALLSYSHGGNDAQKTMGIIVGLLVSARTLFENQTGWLHYFYLADNKTIPHWIEIGAYSAI